MEKYPENKEVAEKEVKLSIEEWEAIIDGLRMLEDYEMDKDKAEKQRSLLQKLKGILGIE